VFWWSEQCALVKKYEHCEWLQEYGNKLLPLINRHNKSLLLIIKHDKEPLLVKTDKELLLINIQDK
jgi:hypothetical protein